MVAETVEANEPRTTFRIAEALIEFLKHSKWYRVAKFYSSNPDRRQCQDAMHMFDRMQAPAGILTAFEAAVHEPELVDSDITDFLDNMSAVARSEAWLGLKWGIRCM